MNSGVVYAFVSEGSEFIPENDLAFTFPVAIGVVGLLIPLGAYRGKVGNWASREGLVLLPPPVDDEGDDKSPLKDNLGFCIWPWMCFFPIDPLPMISEVPLPGIVCTAVGVEGAVDPFTARFNSVWAFAPKSLGRFLNTVSPSPSLAGKGAISPTLYSQGAL